MPSRRLFVIWIEAPAARRALCDLLFTAAADAAATALRSAYVCRMPCTNDEAQARCGTRAELRLGCRRTGASSEFGVVWVVWWWQPSSQRVVKVRARRARACASGVCSGWSPAVKLPRCLTRLRMAGRKSTLPATRLAVRSTLAPQLARLADRSSCLSSRLCAPSGKREV